jgi:hypothetical protein
VRYISAEVFRRPIRFRIMAADKLAARDKLGQMFSFISQMVFNGPLLSQLHDAGMTVDFDEFVSLFQDISGSSRRYRLFRAMTPEEIQQYQAAKAQPQESEKLQIAKMESQTRLQMGQMKAQTELEKAKIMSGGPEAIEAQRRADQEKMRLQQELAQLKAQLEKQKAENEAALESLKALLEREKMLARAANQMAPPGGGLAPPGGGLPPEGDLGGLLG